MVVLFYFGFVSSASTGHHPDPLVEIDFWTAKAADLSQLNEQLQSKSTKMVIDSLVELKSPILDDVSEK